MCGGLQVSVRLAIGHHEEPVTLPFYSERVSLRYEQAKRSFYFNSAAAGAIAEGRRRRRG